jgi:MarR family 2-MHQ and catechol resistance regulon transcriptional repressor
MNKEQYDPETQRALKLFVTLSRSFASVAEHARRDIAQHGLSVSEFGVLEILYHKGPTPLGEVAAHILLTTGSVTYVIDQLVAKGLAQRVACPQDRRVRYADLTDRGRELIARLFPAHAECLRRAVAGLDAEAQESAITLLKQLGLAAQSTLGQNDVLVDSTGESPV